MDAIAHNPYLTVLSIVIASIACYTAIDMLGRFHFSHTRAKDVWLVAGAFVLGTGVWAMHFLTMLALELPFAIGHEPALVFQSWLMMMAAAFVCFHVAGRDRLTGRYLLAGAGLVAAGLCGMAYSGLQAMHMQPPISYKPLGVAACALFAWALAAAGLWFAYNLRASEHLRGFVATALASLFLGVGLWVFHCGSLLAVHIPLQGTSAAASPINATWLALFVGVSVLFVMALGVVAAMLDRRLDRQTSELVESLRNANERLEHSNFHDTLTGLPNRPAVYAGIETALARAARDRTRCALLYIDIDGFKLINDSLGHTVGDQLLVRAGAAMQSSCGSGRLLGRIGGDEFLLLIEHALDDEIEALCSQLADRLGNISEQRATLSASIGVAIYPDDAANTATLVTAADMAMYAAKRGGKRCTQRYLPSMGLQMAESFQIQNELRHGIDNDELVVHYQPKYCARNNHLVGAEALVRWQHPQRGLVAPGVFIEVAERSGLISDLELCVIDKVCRQIRDWRRAGFEVSPISINLSVARIRDAGLVEHISSKLLEYALAPRDLIFEITETLAMQEFDTAIRVLSELNALGINVALDDFGTGYSSLSYLQSLPIQQLKIDRSFIANITGAWSEHRAIVQLIIDLSHVLNIAVVAEGVETEEQRLCLQQFGCDELQGFLLGKPMPADDLRKHLPALAPSPAGGFDQLDIREALISLPLMQNTRACRASIPG